MRQSVRRKARKAFRVRLLHVAREGGNSQENNVEMKGTQL